MPIIMKKKQVAHPYYVLMSFILTWIEMQNLKGAVMTIVGFH